RDARRRVGGEVLGVGLVDVGEGPEIGHVDREPDRVVERRTSGGADGLEVLEAANRLLGGGFADQLAAVGVEWDLARAEQEPGGGDGMAVWPDGGRGSDGGHGL